MKSYYSLIRYFNNSLSKENIVIGLIAISTTNVFYRFSESKIKLISKFSDHRDDLLNYNVKKIKDYLDINVKDKLFVKENSYNLKLYIDRLSIYSNGLIQFDKPVELNMDVNEAFFNTFYDKYIGEFKSNARNKKVDQVFIQRVENKFSKPLEHIIDIDYRIEKKIIPSLFFDYKLNGIGVNGSIYSVKCIDINSNRTLENIQKDVSELESLSYRLNRFSEDKVMHPENNRHYLVIDEYKGYDDKYAELYEALISQENDLYKIVNSDQLDNITTKIINSGATKFSALIEQKQIR
ncbi:hypothetical protein [Empedobacter sp. UBA7620]|uniref:hypothetical protein n=1 Tax=Empedobacter sp. UBA7620 TaxID=1946452 RepID=UPI0025C20971|nr:hypothetical protein [Empedobacter sp. UBA7620]